MAISETALLKLLLKQLEDWLPKSWKIKVQKQPQQKKGRPDLLIRLTASDGQDVQLVVEAKRFLEPKDVPSVVEQIQQYTDAIPNSQPVLVAPYLSPRTRERLIEKRVNYWDSTSNAYLGIDQPALYINVTGEDKNPWPDTRSLKSLKGKAAGRIVRALADFLPPYGVRELADRSGTSAPSVSRVIDFLIQEDIVKRESKRGPIANVDWQALIRRWAEDYDFVKSNQTAAYLEPRGLKVLFDKLRKAKLNYAVTGTFAATARNAAATEPRLATIFVEDRDEAAEKLKLRLAETGANVMLLEPYDPVVFERTNEQEDIFYAAPSQVAIDLLTGPGRSPADAEVLFEWMKENENAWRT